jgi:hypothetical protein
VFLDDLHQAETMITLLRPFIWLATLIACAVLLMHHGAHRHGWQAWLMAALIFPALA